MSETRSTSEDLFTEMLRQLASHDARLTALEDARVATPAKKVVRLSEIKEPTLKVVLTADLRVILDADKAIEFVSLKARQMARLELVKPPEGGGYEPRFVGVVNQRTKPVWATKDGFAVRCTVTVSDTLTVDAVTQYGEYLALFPYLKGSAALYPFAQDPLKNVLKDACHLKNDGGKVLETGGINLKAGSRLLSETVLADLDFTKSWSTYLAFDLRYLSEGPVFTLSGLDNGRNYIRLFYDKDGFFTVRPASKISNFNTGVRGRTRVSSGPLTLLRLSYERDGQWQLKCLENGETLRESDGQAPKNRFPDGNSRFVASYPGGLRPIWADAIRSDGTSVGKADSSPRYALFVQGEGDDAKTFADVRNVLSYLNPQGPTLSLK